MIDTNANMVENKANEKDLKKAKQHSITLYYNLFCSIVIFISLISHGVLYRDLE